MKKVFLILQLLLVVKGVPVGDVGHSSDDGFRHIAQVGGDLTAQSDNHAQQSASINPETENPGQESFDNRNLIVNDSDLASVENQVEEENHAQESEITGQEYFDYTNLIVHEADPLSGDIGNIAGHTSFDLISQYPNIRVETATNMNQVSEVRNHEPSRSRSHVMDSFTSGGLFQGDFVNRTYYSDTVHDCQRRCRRKRHCSQFNFRKEEGEDEGECILLRSKTTFEPMPDCHVCMTGPKFSTQSNVGPIVVKKIVAQIGPNSYEGTDDTIKFRFKSGNDDCTTEDLDGDGQSWARGTQEIYDIDCRIENPGEHIHLEARFEMDNFMPFQYDKFCLSNFRVTLGDRTEHSYEEKLCAESAHSEWVTLQRVL